MPSAHLAALLTWSLLAGGAVALQVAEASTEGVRAELRAAVWLRGQDANPGMDKLAALRMSDPNAFNVVQALLKKQMMGMLNMRHPSASLGALGAAALPSAAAFQAPPVSTEPVRRVSGAAAFAKFEDAPAHPPPVVARVELPYADIQDYATTDEDAAPSHPDFMSWKAGEAEERDAELMNGVLGEAAKLRGAPVVPPVQSRKPPAALTATKAKQGFQLPDDVVSGLAKDEAMFSMGDGAADDAPEPAAAKVAVPQMVIPTINWVSPFKAEISKPPLAAASVASATSTQEAGAEEEGQPPAPQAPSAAEQQPAPPPQQQLPVSPLENTDDAKALEGWLGKPQGGETALVQESQREPNQGSQESYFAYLAPDPVPHHRMSLVF